jgi:hypothetical protein
MEIHAHVKAKYPNWSERAEQLTQANISDASHVGPATWSEVKEVFQRAQAEKCAYCERRLGSHGIEWDMDHYRPKNAVKAWMPVSINFRDQPSENPGYYRLAYDSRNYLAACKRCNSTFKGTFFPVSGLRQMTTNEPTILAQESPLLINPLDAADEDPENLIDFLGPIPRPRSLHGASRLRALAVIEMFGLADEDLVRDRCESVLAPMWGQYLNRNAPGRAGEVARDNIRLLCEPSSAHTNCAKAFFRLCTTDEPLAEQLYEAAKRIIESQHANASLPLPSKPMRRRTH